MSKTTLKWSVLGAALSFLWFAPSMGRAQISGDIIEPNVMLLVDSSAGMDFLRESGERPDGMLQFEWSERVCREELPSTDDFTSWQKLQEAMLGSSGTNSRCTVEPMQLRPAINGLPRAQWTPLLVAGASGIPDNILEFRKSHNHFRRVSCSADYWHYSSSSDMYQCIKFAGDTGYIAGAGDAGYVAGVDGTTTTVSFPDGSYPMQSYCRSEDADNVNGLCWNYHPAAQPRLPNGVLDRYDSLARFGIMTVDGNPRCGTGSFVAPCDARLSQWDYGDSRVTSTSIYGYFNGGARGDDQGAVGGLVRLGDDSNERTRSVLLSMEPQGCTEIGGMLDDAGYYFVTDPGALPASFAIAKKDPRLPAALVGADHYYRCRPKIAVLITDGDFGDLNEFENVAGGCTATSTDANWDPLTPAADVQALRFDCPVRSSPEEAWELFDVGQRILAGHVSVLGDVVSTNDEPLYLVVVGFNVPESCKDVLVDPTCNPLDAACQKRRARCVDCTCDPTAIVDPVARAACEVKRRKCLAYTDGFNEKRCFIDACPVGSTCLMTPREYLNEIACQGWPWDPPAAGGVGGHTALVPPPWLDPALAAQDQICEDPSAGNPRPICTLTQGNTASDRGDRALFVTHASDLSKAMDLILGSVSSTVATRTDVLTWNVPTEAAGYSWAGTNEIQRQYEFNSGYVAQAGKPWRGALKRTSYKCNGDVVAEPDAVANVGEQLANQAARQIYAPLEGSQASSEYTQQDPSGNPTNWVSGVGNLQPLALLDDNALNDCDFTQGEVAGICNTDTDTDADHPIQEAVVEHTVERALADIYNSNPALLGPPSEELSNPSYEGYRDAHKGRHPFLFVSTNDGLLHAFDVTAMKEGANPTGNVESWAFVPRAVLSQLWLQYPINVTVSGGTYAVEQGTDAGLYQHLFLGDASPLAVDALLYQDPGVIAPTTTKHYWRAIVVSGLGKGARGYYALDATNAMADADGPSSTRLLRWEIAPDAGMWGNNDVAAQAQLSKMGRTLSRPALAYVYYSPTGSTNDLGQFAAAILPGGYNPSSPPIHNTGVYIVRLGDGKLIRYLEPGAAGSADMCDGSAGLKEEAGAIVESAQFLGEPSVPFGARQATVTSSAFIGDDRGRLWKIHMAGSDVSKWCLELYFDTLLAWDYPYDDCVNATCTPSSTCYNIDCCTGSASDKPCAGDANAPRNMDAPRITLLGAPTIAQNKQGKNVLVFGVGSMDSLATWSRSRIFSITEGGDSEVVDNDTDDTDPGITRTSPSVNWWIGDAIPSSNLPDGGADWTTWHTGLRTKMSGKQVSQTYSGAKGEDFFNVGEKLVGRPVVFNEVAYFTTFLPVSDPSVSDACNSGGSRIWGVDYEERKGENNVIEATYNTDDFGKLGVGANAAMFVETPYHGALLSGVKVVARPRCSTGLDYDVYELTAQKANPTYQQGSSQTVSASAITTVAQRLGTQATPLSRFVRFDSWSIVFE